MWKLKVLIQFVLAKLPFGESLNHGLQHVEAMRHGGVEGRLRAELPERCESVRTLNQVKPLNGARVVEVGTGWAPLPTLMMALFDVEAIETYDHQKHLRMKMLRSCLRVLREKSGYVAETLGLTQQRVLSRLDEWDRCQTVEEVLRSAKVRYHAPADASRTGLPAASIDAFYSYAVLEHVPEDVFHALAKEAARVLRPGGVFYALIGLHDHYAGFDARVSKVNFLRYPERKWAFWVKNRISYHNRMRERDFIEYLANLGASIRHKVSTTDPADLETLRTLPIDSRFARYTPDELAVTRSELVVEFVPVAGRTTAVAEIPAATELSRPG